MDNNEVQLEQQFSQAVKSVLSLHFEIGKHLGLPFDEVYSRLYEIATGTAGETGFDLIDRLSESWSLEIDPREQVFENSATASFRTILAWSPENGFDQINDYALDLIVDEFENSFGSGEPNAWPAHQQLSSEFS